MNKANPSTLLLPSQPKKISPKSELARRQLDALIATLCDHRIPNDPKDERFDAIESLDRVVRDWQNLDAAFNGKPMPQPGRPIRVTLYCVLGIPAATKAMKKGFDREVQFADAPIWNGEVVGDAPDGMAIMAIVVPISVISRHGTPVDTPSPYRSWRFPADVVNLFALQLKD